MTHDEAFLEAIGADPDDDGPRLLYADWLETRRPAASSSGCSAALARMDEYDPRRWDLTATGGRAAAAHQQQWLAKAQAVGSCIFRRGFLDSATMGLHSFVSLAPELFRLGPLPSLRLVIARGNVAALMNCPFAPRIRCLSFDCSNALPLQVGDVEALASSGTRCPG